MGRRRNGPLLSTRDDDDDDDDDEVRSLQAPNIQCESKNPPLRFSDIFPKRLGIGELACRYHFFTIWPNTAFCVPPLENDLIDA